jgi:hypothetical protein
MKSFIVFTAAAFFSTGVFAKSLLRSSCNVYLPTNDTVTSWAGLQTDIISKGYSPIELTTEKILKAIKKGDLVAEISYQMNASAKSFLGIPYTKTSCTVELSLKEVLEDADGSKMLTLYFKKSSASKCIGPERAVVATLPTCTAK